MFVKVSETYDLSTKVNKMGLVTVHTPRGTLPLRLWGGLISQHKKMRFASCDLSLACASILPADPLQVGVEAGDIAPQDMFNPILYSAVSASSYNNLLMYMYKASIGDPNFPGKTDTDVNQGSITTNNEPVFKTTGAGSTVKDVDQFQMYYGLLSNGDFRKAMPQAGLSMRGLKPMVNHVFVIDGINQPQGNSGDQSVSQTWSVIGQNDHTSGNGVNPSFMRGRVTTMPAINTAVFDYQTLVSGWPAGVNSQYPNSVISDEGTAVGVVPVAAIILPPAKLSQLYYRLKITWTIELTGLQSLTAISGWSQLAEIGQLSYASDYTSTSAQKANVVSETVAMDLADAGDASLSKIMEGC